MDYSEACAAGDPGYRRQLSCGRLNARNLFHLLNLKRHGRFRILCRRHHAFNNDA